MRSRPGNGEPESVSSGNASAAASDTAPRIPAQERKTPPRAFGMPPVIRFGRSSATKTQAKRSRITTAHTSAAYPRSRVAGMSPSAVEHDGELEPDEDEEECVQEVLDDPPDRIPCWRTWDVVSSGVYQPR